MARVEWEQRAAAGDVFHERLTAAIATLPEPAVRQVAQLLNDEAGCFGDHLPEFREGVEPFACSGETYHYCSFSTQHDPGCPAVGGDGTLTNAYSTAEPCAPDCGPTDAEPWCRAGGFGCASCDCVGALLGLLAAAGCTKGSR